MKNIAIAAAMIAGLGTSGCAALLAGGAGAAAVACTEDEIDCPPGEVVNEVAGMVDRPLISGTNAGLFDTNRNGLFERTEYTAFRNNMGMWDTNRDRVINRAEFGAGWNSIGWDDDTGAFSAFDDNSDGIIGNDEFFSDDEFGLWDEDQDGVLDDDEWF